MRHAVLVLAAAAAACGGSTTALSTADIQAFNTAGLNVSTAAATYGSQAAAMTDSPSCSSAEAAYDSQVRPSVSQMQGLGTAMDEEMGSMGHMSDADMECAANAMMAELDRHKGVACASTTDMTPNKAEAQQHVTTMTQWANHQLSRSHDMGSMMGMGMGGMSGGGMTTGHCVHNADGSYTYQP